MRIAAGLLLPPVLLASAFASAQTLSWEDCVKLAAESNPALKASTSTLFSSQNQVLASRSGFFPQVSGSVGYNYANTPSVSGSTSVVLGGPVQDVGASSYTLSLTANQNVFNGLADLARYRQADANERVAQAGLETVKAQLSYNLKVAFENVDYAQGAMRLAREIISRREQNLRLVELRFKDGHENKGSVLLYQAYLMDARFGELQSKDNLRTAKAQLAQALGIEDFESLEISGSVPTHEPSEAVDLKQLAIGTPAYKQALGQESFADAGVTLAESGFIPTLGLTGVIGRSGTWFPNQDHWSVGATLTLPIFNGGRDFYGTRSALDARTASQATLRDTSHQALTTLQQARTAYIEAAEKLKVDAAYLEAAKVRAEIARANYNNGLMSFQDWDIAENDLIARQKNQLSSQQQRVVAEAAWEQAQGKGVIP